MSGKVFVCLQILGETGGVRRKQISQTIFHCQKHVKPIVSFFHQQKIVVRLGLKLQTDRLNFLSTCGLSMVP